MLKQRSSFHRFTPYLLVLIPAAVILMLSTARTAQAATRTVYSYSDHGPLTLRAVVGEADSGDTIVFNYSLSGHTITLESQIAITKNLTIDGAGLDLPIQISGGDSVRVFSVHSGVTAAINQIVFTNGDSTGGGGGAIYNEGVLTISNSTFSDNQADVGGAIFNQESLTISNSTFENNTAEFYGGGIHTNLDSVLNIHNSTIAYNDARWGGGINTVSSSTTSINNSTFAVNSASGYGGGGALQNDGTLHLRNTILAYSTGSDICVNLGTIATNTNNLISDLSCPALRFGNAQLFDLADNGGPNRTMALAWASPARNWGDYATCEDTDQRGVSRTWNFPCDIGAYEYASRLVVNDLDDPGDGTCDVVECTLRDAVTTIETSGWISFDPALAGGLITLDAEIEIPKNMIISGATLSSNVQVSGGDSVRVFNILENVTADFRHLDIVHGAEVAGGGIYNDGALTVSYSSISDNNGSNVGGGIYNHGTLVVITTTVSGNTAGLYGAGIYNYEDLTVSGSSFIDNQAVYAGGGIYTTGATTTTVSNSTFYLNATGTGFPTINNGGGIYSGGPMVINNCTLSGNSAYGNGGALYVTSGGNLHLMNTILAGSVDGGDCVSAGGIFSTNLNNLVQDGSCSPAVSGPPLLGPIGDNGGPTQTMALQPGSPAIDAGDNATCEAVDQRGVPRPRGLHCDIGAFEEEQPYLVYLPQVLR